MPDSDIESAIALWKNPEDMQLRLVMLKSKLARLGQPTSGLVGKLIREQDSV